MLERLPASSRHKPRVANAATIELNDEVDAAIIHPPYFNAYKYSSVLSLEMAWLDLDRSSVAGHEVREGFKQGKNAKLPQYLDDILAILRQTTGHVKRDGSIALMIGDTVLCGEYIQVVSRLLERTPDLGLVLESLAVRPPKFTEASWVTSQRRSTALLGVGMADYVLVFRNGR
jgi:hypothetical protein